jgi:hypothetical protein
MVTTTTMMIFKKSNDNGKFPVRNDRSISTTIDQCLFLLRKENIEQRYDNNHDRL